MRAFLRAIVNSGYVYVVINCYLLGFLILNCLLSCLSYDLWPFRMVVSLVLFRTH